MTNNDIMKTSNLISLIEAVKQIEWSTKKVEAKAIKAITKIYTYYFFKKIDYNQYLNLSQEYFKTIIGGKTDHINEIKKKLVEANILITTGSYNIYLGLGKTYKINQSLLYNNHNNTDLPHYQVCLPLFETINLDEDLATNMTYIPYKNRLTIFGDVNETINQLIILDDTLLKTNEDITDKYVYIHLNKRFRYGRDKAIALAKTMGVDLIKYKDKFYLETIEDFKARKPKELRMCFSKKVFDIQNECFYEGRNETNNRLDYNLTSYNKDLFKHLRFDGEELVELDIANAQYAIASYINPNIDTKFIELTQSGELYSYIANKLSMTEKEAKGLMFRVSFDKVKTDKEFEDIRVLFPLFMQWVDSYKKLNGYKLFSNLLQKQESKVMIDGLFTYLLNKGYETFPIHDAIRVKQSQVNEIEILCKRYFESIDFKCKLRNK